MNDEANTHYFAMLDQLMEGHLWLQDNIGKKLSTHNQIKCVILHKTVGVKPQSGWAIDPFGYTPTMAYLLQRMGLHNMLIQRTHYAIKKYFSQQKQLEFLWRQSWGRITCINLFVTLYKSFTQLKCIGNAIITLCLC